MQEVKHAANSHLAWAGCIEVDAGEEEEEEDDDAHDDEGEGEGGRAVGARVGRIHRAVLKRGLEAGKRYHIWLVSESVEEEQHLQEGGEKHTPCLGQLTKLVVQMEEEGEEDGEDEEGETGAAEEAQEGNTGEGADSAASDETASLKRYGSESAQPSPFASGLVYPLVVPTSVGFDLVSVLGDELQSDPADVFYVIRTASDAAVGGAVRPSAAEVVEGVHAVSSAVGGGCCNIQARNWSQGGGELDTTDTDVHPACSSVWDIDGLQAGISYVIYVAVKTRDGDGVGRCTNVSYSEVSEISVTVDWALDEEARNKLIEEKKRRDAAAAAARKKREEEDAARLSDEEAAKKAKEEEDARKAAEEAAKKAVEEAAKQEAEDVAKRAEEEAARQAAEEERRRALEAAEAARKLAEEERKRALDAAEAARKLAEEERKRALEVAEAARRLAEEKAAADKSAEAEEAVRKAVEAAERARKEAEEAARKEAEEAECARKEAEEVARKEAEEAERIRKDAEEAAKREAEARRAAAEAARKAAEQRAKREAEAAAALEAAEAAARQAAEERAATEAAAAARAKKKEERDAKKRSKKDKKSAAAAAKKEALAKYLAEKAAAEAAELEARAEARRVAAEARKKAAAEAAVRIAARQAEAEARAEELRNKANHVGVKGLMEMKEAGMAKVTMQFEGDDAKLQTSDTGQWAEQDRLSRMDVPTTVVKLRLTLNVQGGSGRVQKLVLAVGVTWVEIGAKILRKLKLQRVYRLTKRGSQGQQEISGLKHLLDGDVLWIQAQVGPNGKDPVFAR
jgi:hypothetical protein